MVDKAKGNNICINESGYMNTLTQGFNEMTCNQIFELQLQFCIAMQIKHAYFKIAYNGLFVLTTIKAS